MLSGCVNEYTHENPAWGQCAVTALIVQDYFGGDILYCNHANHYWNRLPTNEEIDFTRRQFPDGTIICFDEMVLRDSLLNDTNSALAKTPERYQLLINY